MKERLSHLLTYLSTLNTLNISSGYTADEREKIRSVIFSTVDEINKELSVKECSCPTEEQIAIDMESFIQEANKNYRQYTEEFIDVLKEIAKRLKTDEDLKIPPSI